MHSGYWQYVLCGIVSDVLMARVGQDQYFQCLELEHAREMDFEPFPSVIISSGNYQSLCAWRGSR